MEGVVILFIQLYLNCKRYLFKLYGKAKHVEETWMMERPEKHLEFCVNIYFDQLD